MLLPSEFARASAALGNLAAELKCERRSSPLELLEELNEGIYKVFAYVPSSTKVDSPIDEALRTRQGVCQDFAHIMMALVRSLHVLPLCERLPVSPRCRGREGPLPGGSVARMG
jgi:hypothetical protein